jgi:serine/threonine protein kinase
MTYGKTPFSHLSMVKAIHAITDEKFEIEFPSIPNQYLLEVLKNTLQRNPLKRMTIPDLLKHPFVTSSNFVETIPEKIEKNRILVDQNELFKLIQYVSKNDESLSKEILQCLKEGTDDILKFLK